ncbi:JAB domain-containing protein [Emticicia sp. CRIBPO]|uniref:JAB domain-containing protein n=1 Tax=Emticicia sp. CRIBPO TaxID=2683258 RepID=UPI00286DC9BF|nr:JAB domain-containing protein [Emticicia sp. CRIBPO]
MFRIAVYKLTTKLILVHNHPSGNTNVSDLDKSLTNRLMVVGQLLEIQVIDQLKLENTLHIAKKMKLKGMDIKTISEITGLSPEDI